MRIATKFSSLLCLLSVPLCPVLWAAEPDETGEAKESRLEIVIVTGVRMGQDLVLNTRQVAQPSLDNSDLLRMFPGGNRNANGPLTNISQYRGLFGAQNSVAIDGIGYVSDCPNWMDTPLSSIPHSLTESVTLFRGLGSVDAVAEGLGGAIGIESRSGTFGEDEGWSSYGNAEAGYSSNAHGWSASVFSGIRNNSNWLNAAASKDKGDDYGFDGGVVSASQYDREQYRLGYGHRFTEAELSVGAVINRTGQTGTPALPMDIRYINSEQYQLALDTPAGPGQLAFRASTLSVDHVMDNFTSRPVSLNQAGRPTYRESAPFGETNTAKLTWEWSPEEITFLFGLDGNFDSHTAKITDPANGSFYVLNFNDVNRDRAGGFAIATRQSGAWDLELNLRYNRVNMNAGEVSGFLGAMPPQQARLDKLAAEFNASNRAQSDNQWIGLLKASRAVSEDVRLNLGLGRKMRSPSYQERYLWLPLEATAGLADGRTYIGDVNLKPEKSIEFTAGIDWNQDRFRLTPEFFYRDIDDYIQGVPSTNSTANLFAMMMNGAPPLQYANVKAEMYGFDVGYEWRIAEGWSLQGNFSYVRGKRTDIEDNLYRIAPLSSFLELRYEHERWFVSAESVVAAKQDDVAAYNHEQTSAGWGILNLRAGVELGRNFSFGLGVENLTDAIYQDHLGGYNRVMESDVPVGVRLYGKGRNFYLRLKANW